MRAGTLKHPGKQPACIAGADSQGVAPLPSEVLQPPTGLMRGTDVAQPRLQVAVRHPNCSLQSPSL